MLVRSGNSCFSDTTIAVVLKATPTVVFTEVQPVCVNANSLSLAQATGQNSLPGVGTYTGRGVVANNFSPSQAGAGEHMIRYTFNAANGCAASDSQVIVVYAAPVVSGGAVEILEGGSSHLPATVQGLATLRWSPATAIDSVNILHPLVSPVVNTIYTLTATNNFGCVAAAQVTVSVLKNLVIPNAFSPNGDGINDSWNIQSLGSYNGAKVSVFNRYGKLVFTSTGYTQPWSGTYNGSALPTGTYYYIIDTKKAQRPFTGSVTLLR